MSTALILPFGTDPVEVPLTSAPLAIVIAQVRYPKTLRLIEGDAAEQVRDLLLAEYPILREERTQQLVVDSSGITPLSKDETLWRLQDKGQQWQLTLAPEFIALDTTNYVSREDFCARLGRAVEAVAAVASPIVFDRIGVRYVNRVAGERIAEIHRYVRPELVSVAAMPDHASGGLVHAITDFLYAFEDKEQVRARWGRLPAGGVLETTVERLPEPSWVLDIDASSEHVGDFTAEAVERRALKCATRAYEFFRWAVTDDLLSSCGGTA